MATPPLSGAPKIHVFDLSTSPFWYRFSIMKPFTAVFSIFLILAAPICAAESYSKAGPIELTKDGRHWVDQTLKKLSLEEKVGQMLSVRYFTDFQNFASDNYRQFRDEMQKYHVGSVVLTVHVDGPMLLRNPPLEVARLEEHTP